MGLGLRRWLNKGDDYLMRLLAIFFIISAFVYYVTGKPGKYSRRQRLVFALLTYVGLYAAMLATVLLSGDQP